MVQRGALPGQRLYEGPRHGQAGHARGEGEPQRWGGAEEPAPEPAPRGGAGRRRRRRREHLRGDAAPADGAARRVRQQRHRAARVEAVEAGQPPAHVAGHHGVQADAADLVLRGVRVGLAEHHGDVVHGQLGVPEEGDAQLHAIHELLVEEAQLQLVVFVHQGLRVVEEGPLGGPDLDAGRGGVEAVPDVREARRLDPREGVEGVEPEPPAAVHDGLPPRRVDPQDVGDAAHLPQDPRGEGAGGPVLLGELEGAVDLGEGRGDGDGELDVANLPAVPGHLLHLCVACVLGRGPQWTLSQGRCRAASGAVVVLAPGVPGTLYRSR
mmetsp:Transcript_75818/g.214365  ORF Transcript_75818/g.214365 Transcript_75818/m.214365 type:complete len:324 (+) Transcript_75818:168-1139(+)